MSRLLQCSKKITFMIIVKAIVSSWAIRHDRMNVLESFEEFDTVKVILMKRFHWIGNLMTFKNTSEASSLIHSTSPSNYPRKIRRKSIFEYLCKIWTLWEISPDKVLKNEWQTCVICWKLPWFFMTLGWQGEDLLCKMLLFCLTLIKNAGCWNFDYIYCSFVNTLNTAPNKFMVHMQTSRRHISRKDCLTFA